ncbi:cytochrome P450 1A1-like isoform X1 [Ranitomeya variabilis]|uniref:cytochrome P450 1A1-like isoform X1 n=1 Tax=Ranitomeya variabilis TaxID=490064 RepID=UPI004056A28E
MASVANYFLGDLFSFEMVALLILSTLLLILTLKRKRKMSVPGPWALPIFGNFFQIGGQAHISLTEMRKTYGDVFLIKLGMMPVVVVSGFETVKKVLGKQGEHFANRPNMYSFSLLANGKSMTFSEKYGETWKIHKKIMRNALRTLSKSEADSMYCSCRLEEYVCAEASDLIDTMQEMSKDHGSFNPSPLVILTVANVVCALCFGKRYNHNDREFLHIIEVNNDVQKVSGVGLLADFIPVFKFLPSTSLNKLKKFTQTFNNFIAKSVQEHYGSHDQNNIRDITDALIKLCNDRNSIDKNYKLSNEQIIATVNDIFGAGFDTISSALLWCMLYLLKFPEMQEKIQKEIDEIIGTSRLPRFEDRKDLHYTEAFINEVLRHSSFVPFTIPHCTTMDTILNGYWLPKDTSVFINIFQVNHDQTVWKDANMFIPERFLDQSGHIDKSLMEKVFIFGMGVRKCVGEDIARNEMFIFLTTILQHLKLFKDSELDVDLTPVFGLTMKPKPYNIRIEVRI